MTEIEAPRGGLTGFLTSIPGILTALAALVTAAGGIYLGVNHSGASKADESKSPVVINLQMPGGSAPSQATSVDEGTLRTSSPSAAVASVASGTTDPIEQLASGCSDGDPGACADLLDTMASRCFDGSGAMCDGLYEISPVDSDWETYGATCGGRFSVEAADTCSQR